jgi:hypothetical protein
MYYIGGNSESVEQDALHAYDMAFGGGGFAISYPLAAQLVQVFDGCLDRYFRFYGSDQRVWACVSEIGVPLTRLRGFHQVRLVVCLVCLFACISFRRGGTYVLCYWPLKSKILRIM